MDSKHTEKELNGLYEMAEKLAPTHPDYEKTMVAIREMERIQLEKDRLKLQEEENAQRIALEHEYKMRQLDIESDFKDRELAQQKEQAESQKKLKTTEIVTNGVLMVGLGLITCFAEETRMISKNLWGLATKIIPKH